jgi:hypothetical protein
MLPSRIRCVFGWPGLRQPVRFASEQHGDGCVLGSAGSFGAGLLRNCSMNARPALPSQGALRRRGSLETAYRRFMPSPVPIAARMVRARMFSQGITRGAEGRKCA